MNKKVDVCIVGGGPGGALLANILAKNNVSVLLIGQTNAFAIAFREEHLHEEGERILNQYEHCERIDELTLLRMEKLEDWRYGEKFTTMVQDPGIGHLGSHVP